MYIYIYFKSRKPATILNQPRLCLHFGQTISHCLPDILISSALNVDVQKNGHRIINNHLQICQIIIHILVCILIKESTHFCLHSYRTINPFYLHSYQTISPLYLDFIKFWSNNQIIVITILSNSKYINVKHSAAVLFTVLM